MEDLKPIWRVNRKPRFTVLELGEYMAADDGPRETILRNMHYERVSRSLIYRLLWPAVSRFLASPTRDRRILAECKIALEEAIRNNENPQGKENLKYELNALAAFERSLNALEIGGLNLERAAPRRLMIEGVTISVRPSAHILVSRQRGADLHGAVLIDVAKGIAEPKTDEAKTRLTDGMMHSAIILHQHVVETAPEGGKPSPEHCFIFHAHRQERVAAPTSYKKTYRNIEAVCRNIARSWSGIVPPDSFDKSRATYRT
jgi:hypothetical protein